MGVYAWNNMRNLWQETVLNETADLIIQCVILLELRCVLLTKRA